MYWSIENITTGVLHGVYDTPKMPDVEDRKVQAASDLGGTANDWRFLELTYDQLIAVQGALPRRSKMVNGVLTHAETILLTLSSTTVQSDDLAEITLGVDCQDDTFVGDIRLKIINPNQEVTLATKSALAGVANFYISTPSVGVHQVIIETILHGFSYITFEGI